MHIIDLTQQEYMNIHCGNRRKLRFCTPRCTSWVLYNEACETTIRSVETKRCAATRMEAQLR